MSITRRKLCPYAKQFVQHDPELPLAWVYFGPNAWDAREEINSRSIILPPYENPSYYDWRILKNQIVIGQAKGNTEQEYRHILALEILEAGAEQILIIMPRQLVEVGIHVKWLEMDTPHEQYK
jgi:hypothetical protein